MVKKLFYIMIVFFVILIDQISKWMVTELLFAADEGREPLSFLHWVSDAPERLSYHEIEVLPFYNLVMVWNEGVSFGMMNIGHDYMPLILSGISLVVSLAFMVWMLGTKRRITALSLALIVGGALGNVIDRMRFEAVIDFLDFHAMGYHWPAFNIADSCIVIGVFALLIDSFFFEKSASDQA